MNAIAPGWYKDPADPANQRWWDGEGWIGDPIPAEATPPAGPPQVKTPPAASVASTPSDTAATPQEATPLPGAPASGHTNALPATGTGRGKAEAGQPGATGPWPPSGRQPTPGAPGQWPVGYPFPIPAPRPHGLMLAGAGSRLVARLVDILAVFVLSVIANAWFAVEFWRDFQPFFADYLRWTEGNSNPFALEGAPTPPESISTLLLLMCAVITAVWFAYEVPASANSGQTLGKRLVGIKVVRVDSDGRLGFGRSLRRWSRLGLPTLFWPLCCGLTALLQVVDCLFVAIDRPLHQALHDKGARTVVVQVPRPGRPETEPTPTTPYESATGGRHVDPR